MENFHVCLVEDFPTDLLLFGDSKFRTPRCQDEKVPILVLPQCVTNGLSTFRDKTYLHLTFPLADRCKFDRVMSWLEQASSKTLHPFLTEEGGGVHMKIKLPPDVSVLNVDGSETSHFQSSDGSTIRCAVEIPCLWETDDRFGLTFQMVQCKIMREKECMIEIVDENPQYVPFDQSSGSSVYGRDMFESAGGDMDLP